MFAINIHFVYHVSMNNFNLALQFFGTSTKLARAIGVRTQVVNNWRKRGIPSSRAKQISEASGEILDVKDLLS